MSLARVTHGGVLVSEFADDPEIFDIVVRFVESLPFAVATLREATERQELERLRRLAHQLKGSAGGVGFPTITEAASCVEVAASQGSSDLALSVDVLTRLCLAARACTQGRGTP